MSARLHGIRLQMSAKFMFDYSAVYRAYPHREYLISDFVIEMLARQQRAIFDMVFVTATLVLSLCCSATGVASASQRMWASSSVSAVDVQSVHFVIRIRFLALQETALLRRVKTERISNPRALSSS